MLPDLIPQLSLAELDEFIGPALAPPVGGWVREQIKQWDLSYVERISTLPEGPGPVQSAILKIVAPPWAREAQVYHLLGEKPPLRVPRLLRSGERGGLTWMLIEDVSGDPPVDQTAGNLWREAVAGLARLHHRRVDEPLVAPALPRYSSETLVRQVRNALEAFPVLGVPEAAGAQAELINAATCVAEVLDGDDLVLIHGDCYADNFVPGSAGLTLVDWSFGALAPGLLDVAALVYPDPKNEGLPVPPEFILQAYADTAGQVEEALTRRLAAARLWNQLLHLLWMFTRLKEGYTSVGPVDRWTAYALGETLSAWGQYRSTT